MSLILLIIVFFIDNIHLAAGFTYTRPQGCPASDPYGNLNFVRLLVEGGPDPTETDVFGSTPIHYANSAAVLATLASRQR